MIVTCEQCEKKYKIDETKLKEGKTLFKCEGCGSIIEVVKPRQQPKVPPAEPLRIKKDSSISPASQEPPSLGAGDDATATSKKEKSSNAKESLKNKKKKSSKSVGLSIRLRLLGGFMFFIMVLGGLIAFFYQRYVPSLVEKELHQRAYSISRSLDAAVSTPVLLNNYLEVNKAAEIIANLPGVAYASVLNGRSVIVAGIFGDSNRFDTAYRERIQKERFPIELSKVNAIPQGKNESAKKILIGGQSIYDLGVSTPDLGGEIHVGIYTGEIDKIVRVALPLLLGIIGGLGVIGGIGFFVAVSSIVSKPIRRLTVAAHNISLGEIDLPIGLQGGGEIAELATSLERMRFSIKSAIDRLRRR